MKTLHYLVINNNLINLLQGFVIPCANSLGGRWFPPNEKSSMAALYTSGNQVSFIFTTFLRSELYIQITWLCDKLSSFIPVSGMK